MHRCKEFLADYGDDLRDLLRIGALVADGRKDLPSKSDLDNESFRADLDFRLSSGFASGGGAAAGEGGE